MANKTGYILRLFGKNIVVEVDDDGLSNPKSDDHDERAAIIDTPSSSCIVDDVVVAVSTSSDPTTVYNPMPLRCVPPDQTNPQPVSWDGASTSSISGEDREQRKKAAKRKQEGVGVGVVEKKRRSAKRRCGTDGEQHLGEDVPIPPGLLQYIESRNGTDVVFLYQKVLTKSDVDRGLNRLFIGGEHKFFDYLTPSEISAVGDSKSGGLEVSGIDPQEYSMKLKKWASLNILILNVDWNKLVRANKGDVRDSVRIWGYRVEGKLSLAFSFVKTNNSGSSSNSTTEEGTSNSGLTSSKTAEEARDI